MISNEWKQWRLDNKRLQYTANIETDIVWKKFLNA